MLAYPHKALSALAFLFRPFNDIDIFVEDTTCRNMYETLINRMLDGKAKVQRIFPVGGKDQVIEACRRDQSTSTRRRLYIIDGDFEAFFGEPPLGLNYLYRLGVYSSENLVFSASAVYQIAYECMSEVEKTGLEKKIKFEAFLEELVQKLSPLFKIYCVACILESTSGTSKVETAGWNATCLVERIGGEVHLSQSMVDQRISEIEGILVGRHTRPRVESATTGVDQRIATAGADVVKFIPGKTHLLPLLYHYLSNTVNYKGTLKQLRVRLARDCELDADAGLVEAVKRTARD